MSGFVRTVLGKVSAEDIGITLTHEHLCLDYTKFYVSPPSEIKDYLDGEISLQNVGFVQRYPYSSKSNISFFTDDLKAAVINDVKKFKKFGGSTIVENTTHGLKRDLPFLKKVSEVTGVKIIAGTGFYLANVQQQSVLNKTVEELYDDMKLDLISGCPDLPEVKCGVIGEVASDYPIHREFTLVLFRFNPFATGGDYSPYERAVSIVTHSVLFFRFTSSFLTMTQADKVVETSTSMYNLKMRCYNQITFEAKAIKATGLVQEQLNCPATFHPGRNTKAPSEIMRLFTESGGNASKAVMSHLDRTLLTSEDLLEFADEYKCFLQHDLFGTEVLTYQFHQETQMPSDFERIKRIKMLVENGYLNRILISQDIHTKHRLADFGGHGYFHVICNIVPKMQSLGLSHDIINNIIVNNPKNWLSWNPV